MKNIVWYQKCWLWGLAISLAVSIFFAWIGWHKYRQERNYNEGFKITQFEPLGGI